MGVCFKYRLFTVKKNHAIQHSVMLTNKTLFENIYKFDDCHIRICVHYDESQPLLNLLHVLSLGSLPAESSELEAISSLEVELTRAAILKTCSDF